MLSYNVRGLSSKSSKVRQRTFLKDSQVNVWFFSRAQAFGTRKCLAGRQHLGYYSTTVAARHDVVIAGKGGLAIGISPALYSIHFLPTLSTHHAEAGRALFVDLDGLLAGPISLLNVYCRHTSADRMQLWKMIILSIDETRPWILDGDWIFQNWPMTKLEAHEKTFWLRMPHFGQISKARWAFTSFRSAPIHMGQSRSSSHSHKFGSIPRFLINRNFSMHTVPTATFPNARCSVLFDHLPIKFTLRVCGLPFFSCIIC